MTIKEEIIQISKDLKLSHIGSCLSVLPILEKIYAEKKLEDKVGMSNAHAHLAHLVVMEHNGLIVNSKELIEKYGIHCNQNAGCDVSGGSLGHTGIAVGLALSDRSSNVHWIESDGSVQEGSFWEALRIKKQLNLDNLKIYVNLNGFTAVEVVDREDLSARIKAFCPEAEIWHTSNGEGFNSVEGHYKTI